MLFWHDKDKFGRANWTCRPSSRTEIHKLGIFTANKDIFPRPLEVIKSQWRWDCYYYYHYYYCCCYCWWWWWFLFRELNNWPFAEHITYNVVLIIKLNVIVLHLPFYKPYTHACTYVHFIHWHMLTVYGCSDRISCRVLYFHASATR